MGKVFDAVEHVVTWGLEHRTVGQIDAIGVDEIHSSPGPRKPRLVYIQPTLLPKYRLVLLTTK
jgi:hypothetical protein